MVKQRKILSLNGGGVRGLFTITILAEIEKVIEERTGESNVKIGEYFDLIAGASIGGVLALALANGASAREIHAHLKKHASSIFPRKWYNRIPVFNKLVDLLLPLVTTRYCSKPLNKAVVELLGENTHIKDLKRRIIIPVVNISSGTPSIIKTKHKTEWYRDDKYRLVDVAMATSAAPTYFPPHLIDNTYFLDGGLVANDASMIAVHEAKHFLGWNLDNVAVLNIGTMKKGFEISHKALEKDSFYFKWWKTGYLSLWGGGESLIDTILSANQAMQGDMTEQMLLRDKDRYVSLDEVIKSAHVDSITLDNASKQSLQMLESKAENVCNYVLCNKKIMSMFFSQKADEFVHPDSQPK